MLIGYVLDDDVAEIWLAGHWADRREFRAVEGYPVFAVGMSILKGFEFCFGRR